MAEHRGHDKEHLPLIQLTPDLTLFVHGIKKLFTYISLTPV